MIANAPRHTCCRWRRRSGSRQYQWSDKCKTCTSHVSNHRTQKMSRIVIQNKFTIHLFLSHSYVPLAVTLLSDIKRTNNWTALDWIATGNTAPLRWARRGDVMEEPSCRVDDRSYTVERHLWMSYCVPTYSCAAYKNIEVVVVELGGKWLKSQSPCGSGYVRRELPATVSRKCIFT